MTHITDNGAGIPDDKIAHLFEPFYSTKPDGHGLGLFAARHILDMHPGSIRVSSEKGRETCVTVVLPAVPTLDELQLQNSDLSQAG